MSKRICIAKPTYLCYDGGVKIEYEDVWIFGHSIVMHVLEVTSVNEKSIIDLP